LQGPPYTNLTIKHHPNHHRLACVGLPLGSPNSSNWDMWSSQRSASPGDGRQLSDWPTKKPMEQKPLRKKKGCCKTKNCTLHEINLDTCVFSKNNINKYIHYRILLTPVPAFCVCQVLRFPAVWPYAPPAEFEKVEGNGTIHARRLTAIKLGVAGTDLGQKKRSTSSSESQVISLHDLHWIPPTPVCPLIGS